MSNSARIDELRIKFEDNSRRYFAPLANEYRKAGDLAQAIALCREHLPKQPGHMSGYIVFGQALYEAGELNEARFVFEQALDLDPENLIALTHLGNIARDSNDAATAERWYGRVLDADPRNDDIAAQLASLAKARSTSGASRAIAADPPASQTPPIGMPFIGFGAMPTPDAAMRSIDPDLVTRRAVSHTPLDLDAFEGLGRIGDDAKAPATSASAPSAEEQSDGPTNEPDGAQDGAQDGGRDVDVQAALIGDEVELSLSDLQTNDAAEDDVDGASLDDTVPVAEPVADIELQSLTSTVSDTVSPWDEADAFDYPVERESLLEPADETVMQGAGTDGTAADGSVDVDDAESEDAAFEAGLLAPEWPDTTDLVMRVVSPRAFTPLSGTPVSSEAVADAAAAFGREPADADILPEPASIEMTADDAVNLEEADLRATDESLDPAVAQSTANPGDTVEFLVQVESTTEELISDSGFINPAECDDEIAVAESRFAEIDTLNAMSFRESDSADTPPGFDEISAALSADARSAGDDAHVTFGEIDRAFVGEVDSEVEAEVEAEAEAEVEAEVEAAAIAESEVDREPVVETVDEFDVTEASTEASTEAPTEESTDDLNDSANDSSARESSAFVTETMAELLVSQGFVDRAVNVYQELVRRRPYDPMLSARLAALNAQLLRETVTPLSVAAIDPEGTPDVASNDDSNAVDAYTTPLSSPAMPTPAYGAAANRTPSYGAPAYGTPAYGTPAYGTPAYGTPAFSTPYAQPAVADFVTARPTAREIFAALAARRVPRRTPPQPMSAVPSSPEGLASLFGTDTPDDDDAAARALADAFAPVSASDLESGAALDFEFARSTPAYTHLVTPSDSHPAVSQKTSGSFAAQSTPRSTNETFSFDRFFPDPAPRQGTPDASPTVPDAPVTDDLAQFSAWLKGLGNT